MINRVWFRDNKERDTKTLDKSSKPPPLSFLRDHNDDDIGSSRGFARRDTPSSTSHISQTLSIFLWNHLFNDKEFAGKHLLKAPKQSFYFTVTKNFCFHLMIINHQGIQSIQFKGELSPINGESIIISEVFHCEGLLLCTFNNKTRIMLWNPCTGQTRWEIQPFSTSHTNYALGSYQESRYGKYCSYKILSYKDDSLHEFAIYEINSNSWRILDVVQDFRLVYVGSYASLKGKSYWFAYDSKDEQRLDMLLVNFDYTTERFERLSLPFNCPLDVFRCAAISVVSDENLAVLLPRKNIGDREIWVSNKIDGAKEVTWRKFLTVDYPDRYSWITISRFLVDEEKKVALCCEICVPDRRLKSEGMKKFIYIAGEDHKVTLLASGDATPGSFWPIVLDYVPSLVQIPSTGCQSSEK